MATIIPFPKGFLRGYDPFIITSVFGAPRGNNVHKGLDIGCPEGTPLYSPIEGVVQTLKKDSSPNGGFGLYITIRQYLTVDLYFDFIFAHLSKYNSQLAKGVQVSAGTLLGETGGTPGTKNAGHSTGPHLHLEIRKNGTVPVNPIFPFLYKQKCIENNTQKILSYGVEETGFNYTYSSDEVTSISTIKPNGKDTTDWAATEPLVKKKTKIPTSVKGRLAPGIWQIVKILMDSSVNQKQVLDSGISVQQGSLINYFRKVCQEPLVEFMGDTYGDQYYIIVRRPPFDKEGYNRQLELTTTEIQSDMIMSTNLSWNNQGIYSWYQFIPYADLLGIKEGNLFMPAVFFPEYAAIWGSRPLCIESNYYNFAYSGRWNNNKPENKENGDRIIRNAYKDLKFLIESNAYAPFTRRGTIVIQGDRRIKKGTLVSLPSGEIYYVDSVSNSYEVSMGGVSRVTTLQVSRGMYANFLNDKEVAGKKYGYFNIIDFGDTPDDQVTSANWKDIMSKWKVNIDVFGFFMRKEQVFWNQIYLNKENNG